MIPAPNLDRALLACQRELVAIDRGEVNRDDGYAYVATDAMITTCRAVLLRHGVTCRRARLAIGDDGRKVVSTFVVTHADSGESWTDEFEFAVHLDGRDGDKAVAAAATTAWREWLRDLFCLPRRDRGEMDERRGRGGPPLEPTPGAAAQPVPKEWAFDRARPDHMRLADQHFDAHRISTARWRENLLGKMQGKPLGELAALVRSSRDSLERKRAEQGGGRPRH